MWYKVKSGVVFPCKVYSTVGFFYKSKVTVSKVDLTVFISWLKILLKIKLI